MSYKKQQHNTRVIKDADLEIYQELEAEDAKRLICAYLSFKTGQTVNDYFPDKKDNLRLVFMQMIPYLTANAEKYEEKIKKAAENGKKGGISKSMREKNAENTDISGFLRRFEIDTEDKTELGC